MKRFLTFTLTALVALTCVLCLPSTSEARCGRGGIRGFFRGRQPVRTWLHNRPHRFHLFR
jgi:hypothetical protein